MTITHATTKVSTSCDKPQAITDKNPPNKPCIKLSIERINDILQSLTPLTQPFTDKEGNTIQLWSSKKRPVFASVQDIEGKVKIVPGHLIKNPLSPSDTEKEIYQKLSEGPLRRWDFTLDPKTKMINIWPHLIAAGRNGNKSEWDGWHRYTPFKNMTAQQIHQRLLDKGFIPKGNDPVNGKGSYNHPRSGRQYQIDPHGQGRYPEEPNHVDVHHLKRVGMPKKRLAYGRNDGTFKETVQSTKLTGSYNSSHPKGQIPAKGSSSGQIGGVGNQVGLITGLFDSPEAIHEDEHYFYFPAPEGNLPFTNAELQQIMRELASGIFIHDTVPFFSLHFNGDSNMFPVIHPAYQNTLVGRVISMLDYHMKGFLNGAFYDEGFVKTWQQNPTQDESILREHVIDLHDYCQRHLGPDTHYFTVSEFIKAFEMEQQSLLSIGVGNDDPPIFKDYSGFRSSFRIIAKQNSVKKGGNVLSPDSDFDVLYTISPDPAYEDELRRYRMEYGTDPQSYKNLKRAYEAMAQQIKLMMPRLPLFREYFEMLKVVNFFCYYFRTMKEAHKIPILDSKQADIESVSPYLFPFLPRRKCVSEKVTVTLSEAINTLPAAQAEEIHTYIMSMESSSPAIPDRIVNEIAKGYCEVVKAKYSYTLREQYTSPDYYKETARSVLGDVIRQSSLLKAEAKKAGRKFEEKHRELTGIRDRVERNLNIQRQNKQFIETNLREGEEVLPQMRRNLLQIEACISDAEDKKTQLEALWLKPNGYSDAISEVNSYLFEYRLKKTKAQEAIEGIKKEIQSLKDQQPEVLESIPELEKALAAVEEDLQGLNEATQEMQQMNEDPIRKTIELLPIEMSIPGTTIQLFSQQSEEEQYESKRVVGGVGVNLTAKQPVGLDPSGDRMLTSCFTEMHRADDGVLVPIKEGDEVKGHLFKMGFVDFFTSDDTSYGILEGSIERAQQDLTPETVGIFYAIEDEDMIEFTELAKSEKVKWNAKDPHGVSMLHYAAAAGDSFFLEELLKKDVTNTVTDTFGYNLLHYAAREGHIDNVKLLLKKVPALKNTRAKNGTTPLYLAVQNGRADVVAELVRAGASINDVTAYGMTPLYSAIFHSNEELALQLLNCAGIDVNKATEEGSTPLHLAVELGLTRVVEKLVAKGASLNAKRKDDFTPLHVAAQFGRLDAIQVMKNKGGLDLNAPLKSGKTALHIAAQNFHHDIAVYLLGEGANPTKYGWDKETALMVALKSGNTLSANAMIEGYGRALVSDKEQSYQLTQFADFYGKSPMDIAIDYGFLSVIEQLILSGEVLTEEQVLRCCGKIDDSRAVASWVETLDFGDESKAAFIEKALKIAATRGMNKVASMLIRKYKAAGNFVDHEGRGLVHYAAMHDHLNIIKNTIKKMPEKLFVKDHRGNTPALLAAMNDSPRVLKEIVDCLAKESKLKNIAHLLGAAVQSGSIKSVGVVLRKIKDPSIPLDEEGRTALHLATIHGDVQMVAFLKESGCKFDVRDARALTPFHYAVEYGWDDVLDYLFDKKNELPIPADLLYYAAEKGDAKVVKRLVEEQGFSVNASKSAEGEPPIFGAIREGNFEAFAVMTAYGLDLNAKGKENINPLYLAAKLGKAQFVSYLAHKGAVLEGRFKGKTPLLVAAAFGHYDCVQELIQAGADVEAIDSKGNTAQKLAQTYKQSDVVQLLSGKAKEFETIKQCIIDAIRAGDTVRLMQLLKHGISVPLNKSISVTLEGRSFEAPILQLIYLFARDDKKDEMFKAFLKEKGVKVDSVSPEGYTIAHKMAIHGEHDVQHKDLWTKHCENGKTPLHLMAHFAKKEELAKMLHAGNFGSKVDTPDKNGETSLFYAIRGDQTDNVRLLLAAGADANHLNKMKISPLALAAMEDKTMVVKALLEGGVDVNQLCTSNRTTALSIAISTGQKETIRLLLSSGANPSIADVNGKTPIMIAAQKGDIHTVRLLHVQGASLRETDNKGYSVAHYAARSSSLELVDYLRSNGVSFQEKSVPRKAPVVEPKAKASEGVIPFHLASVSGNLSMMQKLDSIGANIEAVDDDGDSALRYATISGNDGCVRFFDQYRLMQDRTEVSKSLVDASRRDNVPQIEALIGDDFALDAPLDPSGRTAVHFAAMLGGVHSLLYLIQQGADMTTRTADGDMPFDLAVKHGKVQAAKLLAGFDGVEVNVQTPDGSTHLHHACANGDIRMAAFLIKNSPDLNALDEQGRSPLFVAAEKRQLQLVSLLLAAGADAGRVSAKGEALIDLIPLSEAAYREFISQHLAAIEESDAKGDTRLQRALRMGDELSIKFFSNIDDLTEKNDQGDTALHLALRLGNESAIRNLLREGAELESKDSRGATSLMIAATELFDHKKVEFLLSLGADHAAEDAEGKTIMQKLLQGGLTNKRRAVFNTFYRAIPPNPPTVVEPEMVELIQQGNIDELLRSIHKGYRTKVKNDTWLHHAMQHGQGELASLLIDLLPRLYTVINDEGEQPLDVACKNGHAESMAVVLAKLTTDAGDYIIKQACCGNSYHFDALHQVVLAHGETITKYSNNKKLEMLKTWFTSAKERLDILAQWKKIVEQCPDIEHPVLDIKDRNALYQVTKGFKAWTRKHEAEINKVMN